MPNSRRLFARSPAALIAAISLASCGGSGGSHAVPQTTIAPTPIASGSSTCTSVLRRGAGRLAPAYASASWVVPNQIAVTYRPSAASRAAQSIDRVVNAVKTVDLGVIGANGHRVLTLPSGTSATSAAAALRQSADVVSVDPVHYRRPSSYPNPTALPANDAVNDTFSDDVDQWYLYRTAVNPTAWQTTQGSTGIAVAVIDTGVDETNTDLSGKLTVRESVITDPTTNVQTVKTGPGTVQDTDGHGTNVAGLAVAQANNRYGFAGVGYNTQLQAYKVFQNDTSTNPCPSANTADEARAIADAVKNGASVINISLGAPQSSGADATEQAAVEAAIAAGVTVVAANGNEYPGSDGQQPDFPAAYAGVIAVGASAVSDDNVGASYSAIKADTVASYSNSGPTLVAPGGDANGNVNDSDPLHWITGYDTTTAGVSANACSNQAGVCAALFNGTSQATPQVAGAIALMMAVHGGARSLTPANVASILSSSSDVIPNFPTSRQGAGRLDVAKAVAASH
ncbi:MAG TPA: S8 family serine peptidase [Candidatus Limnocylindria bacterium]|jgi:hypothetical protein|nr:S8 family serine peptidase [Candidatus Limnocylindria bacterium]